MANLAGFLKPTYTEKTIEVNISDRFLDDEGNPIPFKMKTLSQAQMKSIAKRSAKTVKGNTEIDNSQFIARCIVESTIQPDFKDRELCIAYGTEDPYELPELMLLTAEYEKLGRAFLELNGLEEGSLDVTKITKN